MEESEGNTSKSISGHGFEAEFKEYLKGLFEKGKISNFTKGVSYGNLIRPELHKGGQRTFNPDFEIFFEKGNSKKLIIVDTTNTARSDRDKGKEWDGHWAKIIITGITNGKIAVDPSIKKIYSERLVSTVVVVKKTEGDERHHFQQSKSMIERSNMVIKETFGNFNGIDHCMSFEEFRVWLETQL